MLLFSHTNSKIVFSICLLYIHNKLICSCLCNAEQNNKTSLKNNHEWFIFMTESRLMSRVRKVLLGVG